MKHYIDVLLPLPLANWYTYSLPESLEGQVQTGSRVIVPFGKKKFYTALVANVHYCPPEGYEIKEVTEVLDTRPVLLPQQFRLWKWMASYYLCTMGDVYKAALPSGMKLESETIVTANPDYEATTPLTPREQQVLDLLTQDPEQCITQLEKRLNVTRNILPVINNLLAKGAISVKEELKRNYKPKTEIRVKLSPDCQTEERLHQLFDELGRAPKRLALLMKYLELSGFFTDKASLREVSKKELLTRADATPTIFNGLVEKGIFETYLYEVGRLDREQTRTVAINPLNPAQQAAYDAILSHFREKNVCLLHGVTSSGKTEIYIHLIRQAIENGQQVLYLLPEIALTTQITERLKRVFGGRIGIYHSKFPDAERVEIWQKQLRSEGHYDIILGVRSSVFLPFHNLGLIIVDEEHETTYKQQDPAPRYHARDTAIMLASIYGAKVLLGTATPSIDSYHNALAGKYGLVTLNERYKDIRLPEIRIVDIKELARKKMMNGPFSPELLAAVRQALERHEQAILFQNRRGFAPMIECKVCGWVPKCKNCDVSLTYHKGLNQLTCHYCGYTYAVPRSCPACGSVELVNRGFGTEKIEDNIREIFPDAKVARMDFDTTRSRSAYERIIADFEAGKTHILIGTQMVSKGLDFDHVSVVGILNADNMLNYPDFRAHERAFQLMAQVAGRAGRRDKRGLVILQTKSPDLPVIHQVVTNDYKQMYEDQTAERKLFHYPPFCRFIYVYLKHRKEDVVTQAADTLAAWLRTAFGDKVLGPDKPPVGRIQMLFIKKIVIKLDLNMSGTKVRDYLLSVQRQLIEDERFRSLVVYYDVDPT
ncbi:primosomal protein N' [Phocaeicola coprophilus]|nr:primosomal protein N' [Phocaeicola coprophilus]